MDPHLKLLFILMKTRNLKLKIHFLKSVIVISQDNNVKFLKVKKFY